MTRASAESARARANPKPEDLLLVQMQGVIAEYERAKILERTRRGRLHKVKSGQMLPFYIPPYGYRVVRTPQVPQGMVVLDEVEAEQVRTSNQTAGACERLGCPRDLHHGMEATEIEPAMPTLAKEHLTMTAIGHALVSRKSLRIDR